MAYVNFKAGTLEEITTANKPENLLSFSTDIPSIFKGNKNITNRVIDASLYNNVLGIRKINAEGVYDSEYINMNFARPYIAGSGIDIDSTTNIISIDPDFTIFEIVSSLPVENIQKGKIYLVPSDSSTAQNAYVEYHYLGSGVWEILGEKKSDILNSLVVSNIIDYTSDSIIYDVSIGDSYDTAFGKLQSKLKKDYYTKSDINSAGYIQIESDPTVPSHVKSITQQNITDWNNKLDSFTETDPVFSVSAAAGITSTDITNWNSKTDNEGTITGIIMNGVSKGTTGVVDLGTVLTEHQDLSTYVQWSGLYKTGIQLTPSSTSGPVGYDDGAIFFSNLSLWIGQRNDGLSIEDNDWDTRYLFPKNRNGIVALISDIPNISNYINSANYDSSARKIYLKHDSSTISEINCNDFIKDGMVDTAYVQGANLVISFNTDAGKEAVNVPIADIFNASNYYTKSEIDNAGYLTSFTETDPTVPTHVKSITQQNITDWNNKLSSETQLSKGTTTGSGNAVTDISVSNHQITLTKGSTFLTAHQDIKTINNNTLVGTGNVTINELPTVSSTDNGKVLQVVNGVWTLVSPVTLYSGTGAPDNSQGNNGDLYMQI